MTIATKIRRPIGTMIVYGYPRRDPADDLVIARRLGAEVVEVLPLWSAYPDPTVIRAQVADAGLAIHSAHGCWGGQSIRATRVDLGSTDLATWSASLDDLKRCVDWLEAAGGSCLVVHPGGLSDPEDHDARAFALGRGLQSLVRHARDTGVTICVENMPPGVHPGSEMGQLHRLIVDLDDPGLCLALDTGHAHFGQGVDAATLAAGSLLRTTHVHDNDGRHDSHLPPGLGSIDWNTWITHLDAIGYRGPIMLECIRHLREKPKTLDDKLVELLRRLAGWEGS